NRTQCQHATENQADGTEEGHDTDGLLGRNENRARDPEATVAASPAEPHQHLIEQAVEAPVSPQNVRGTAARDRVEVDVLVVVVPEPRLVVAEQALVTRKTVDLVPDLADGKQRPVHRPVRAVMLVGADGNVAVVR